MALLEADKAFTKILSQYLAYINIVLANLAIELPEHNNINDYAIKLIENKHPFYKPIYSLKLVKLETLKTYIKTYLKTKCI